MAGTVLLGSSAIHGQPSSKKNYKAAVIGRTGGGDYGHGFDVIFKGIPNVIVEAIADGDPAGLKRATDRSGAKRSYADYREMLEKERPDLVSIAPRHPDCHRDMALAAIGVGANIYMEKPMTETVGEADDILRAAEKKGVKIAIGHVRRFTPEFVRIKRLIEEGFIGAPLSIQVQGKQDSRVGGEDLIVLGTHDFDIMRFYFGDPTWCQAVVLQNGHRIQKKDVRRGSEPILVAGDTIRASFGFGNNLVMDWDSVKTTDGWNQNAERQRWELVIRGTKRIIVFQGGWGTAYLDSPFLAHKDSRGIWKELPDPKHWPMADHESHPVRNLIRAIETNTQPLCNGNDGRWAIEMVSAIYESERVGGRVDLPLKDRGNPLLKFA